MAAVSGPTQECTGPLEPVARRLPEILQSPKVWQNAADNGLKTAAVDAVRQLKREANAYLPYLGAAFVRGELSEDDLCIFFRHYAHLYTIGIDSNAACNLSCGYCYLDAYNTTTVKKYLDLEYFRAFLGQTVDSGVDLVALVGKEPFADGRGPQLLNDLDGLSRGGQAFRYGVVTNGTLIDRYFETIPKSVAYIDVSLDGPRLVTDAVRGDGVFEKATGNIRRLVDSEFEVWVSSVLHTQSCDETSLEDFVRSLVGDYGCRRFYFSPVRNFTGSLQPFLLSYEEINRVQELLANISEKISGLDLIVLDHPYEAVWRDYIFPCKSSELASQLMTDSFGNVLHLVSDRCVRKLDIFPHGPWGTCRVDAAGNYLSDVESRSLATPASVGSIRIREAADLHKDALKAELPPMIRRFLANMRRAVAASSTSPSLVSVSIPNEMNREWRMTEMAFSSTLEKAI